MNKMKKQIALSSAEYLQTLLYHTFDWEADLFGLREFSELSTNLARPAIGLLEEYIDNCERFDEDDYEILLIYADTFIIANAHIWQNTFSFTQRELRDKLLLLPVKARIALFDIATNHIIQIFGTQLNLNEIFDIYHNLCIAVGYCVELF